MPRLNAESAVATACLLLGGVLAWGAVDISSEAGYSGVGPNFLPWLVSIVLLVCGAGLLWQSLNGGFHERDTPEGAKKGDWLPFVWVSVAILLNAFLITRIGFVASCTLVFVLAVRGFHQSQGRLDLSLRAWLRDAAVGLALCAPVYWLFSKVLGISLPALTNTGWL
jgi:putative tricarboxylic transport membrane protein